MHVVVKLTIETSKHHERATDKDCWVPSSRLWKLVLEINFCPLLLVHVETVKVSNVLFVSSTEDVNLVLIHGCCMTPPRIRQMCVSSEVKLDTLDLLIDTFWLHEVIQVEHIHIVKMHVLTVASTESHDSVSTQGRERVEPLCLKACVVNDFELDPFTRFDVQCPHVRHISVVRLTTTDDHVLVDKAACVICSWTRNWRVFSKTEPFYSGRSCQWLNFTSLFVLLR